MFFLCDLRYQNSQKLWKIVSIKVMQSQLKVKPIISSIHVKQLENNDLTSIIIHHIISYCIIIALYWYYYTNIVH